MQESRHKCAPTDYDNTILTKKGGGHARELNSLIKLWQDLNDHNQD